jgi:hypothetical protein
MKIYYTPTEKKDVKGKDTIIGKVYKRDACILLRISNNYKDDHLFIMIGYIDKKKFVQSGPTLLVFSKWQLFEEVGDFEGKIVKE